jgi:uridine kinase
MTTVRPMHHEFVEPSRRFADLIIPEGGQNEPALEVIIQKLKADMYSLLNQDWNEKMSLFTTKELIQ